MTAAPEKTKTHDQQAPPSASYSHLIPNCDIFRFL
jgi:hypothetical protein